MREIIKAASKFWSFGTIRKSIDNLLVDQFVVLSTQTPTSFDCTPDMDTVAGHVGLLLDAKPYEEMYEFCDFSLADQVSFLAMLCMLTAHP